MSGEEGEVRSRSSHSHGDSVSSPSLDGGSHDSPDEAREFPLSKPSYREGSSDNNDDYLNIQPRPVTVEYKRGSKKPKKETSRRHSRSRRDRDRHGSKGKSSRREKEVRPRSSVKSRERERQDKRLKPSTSRHAHEHRSTSGRSRHGRNEKDRDRDRKRQDSRSRGKDRVRERSDRRGNDRRRRHEEGSRQVGEDASATKRRRTETELSNRSKNSQKGRGDERHQKDDGTVSEKPSREELPHPILPRDEDMSSVSEAESEEEIPLEKEIVKTSQSATENSGSSSEEEASSGDEKEKKEKESESEGEDEILERAPAWKRELMEQERADAERRAAEEEQEESDRTEERSDVESAHGEDQEEEKTEEQEQPAAPPRPKSPPTPPQLRLPPYHPAIQGCRLVDEFQCLNRIEEGTFGVVYRAKDKRTGETVALKRLKMEREKEGFPITSLREINTLLKAQHENIVTVREIVVGSNMDKIYIVMDYVEHDLKSLMETMKAKRQVFVFSEVKTLLIQLLRAIAHLHDNWLLHRDIKTSNLLLNHRGILKVGDFGLAREYGSPLKQYTAVVVTLWYRAPELLLGAKEYSTPIDVWSVGCVFGELLLMDPLFQGKSEIDQLNKIFQDLGTPNEKIWPGYKELPGVKKCAFVDHPYNQLKKRFAGCNLTQLGMELMNMFFRYDPKKRITAEKALSHPWFSEEPLPKDPALFPTWPAKSEMPHKKTGNSPKPPSGGGQYKDLGLGDEDDKIMAKWGAPLPGSMPPPSGPGFTLKF